MPRIRVPERDDLDDAGQGNWDRIAASPVGIRSFQHLLHSPELAERYVHLTNFFREASMLSLRQREFATLIVARQWDSQYIWTSHEEAALRTGVAAEIVDALKHRKGAAGFDDGDRVVFEYVSELLERQISDETFEAAQALLGERGVVELTVISGYYTMQAHTLAAFEIRTPAGREPLLPV